MNGLQRISYGDITDWAVATRRSPKPRESAALIRITDAMIHPGEPEEEDGG